jgi:alpha-tubulin suppressor-like RCC1 family protein
MATSGGTIPDLRSDGYVYTWGSSGLGQGGNGKTTSKTTPQRVTALSGMTSVGAGRDHTLAVKSNGTLWGWGLNTYGALGDGTTTKRLTPVQMQGVAGARHVAAGAFHTVVFRTP